MSFGAQIYSINEQLEMIQKKQKKHDECIQQKYKDSRYLTVGSSGFEWMSRMPDPIIYDKVANKYYLHSYSGKMNEISYDDIMKDMDSYNKKNNGTDDMKYISHYTLFDKKYHMPISIHKTNDNKYEIIKIDQ